MLEDSVYAWLCKRSRGSEAGRIRAKIALSGLCTHVSNDSIEIRRALMTLRAESKVQYSANSHGEPISAFITVIPPKVETPLHVATWQDVLAASGLTPEDCTALTSVGPALDGFHEADMERLLAGLVRLRDEQDRVHGQYDFNVSATYLLGSSKLLSTMDSRALRTFGIAVEKFSSRESYIIVGGNTMTPASVILIENPISFETAVTSAAAKTCLFMCTFGFGLSASSNDYGNQLACTVENGNALMLNRSNGSLPEFASVIRHSNIYFWGDLDPAGIQIYLRLKKHISNLQLSALYSPMIAALKCSDQSHQYVMATGKNGQNQMTVTCPDSDEIASALLRICTSRGVDQEILPQADIPHLSGSALGMHHFEKP